MNALLWLPRALWKIYFLIIFCLALILFYPFFYIALSRKDWFRYAFQFKKMFVVFVCLLVGVWPLVKRKGKLPDGPFIICPNHTSYLDIVVMYLSFSRYFVMMGKKELENWPLFGIFFTRRMDISVDRGSPAGALEAMKRARSALRKNIPVVIFPEATIPPSAPRMKAFKNGAFKLAVENNVPIVPVTFINNWKMMQGSKFLKGKARPGFSRVVVHEPIHPSADAESPEREIIAIKTRVFEAINGPLKQRYNFC